MYILGKTSYCTNGHAQLWQLCWIIQSDMLNVIILKLTNFVPLPFFSISVLTSDCQLQQSLVPLQFALPDVVIAAANYLLWKRLVEEWHLLPCIAQAAFQLWGHPEVNLLPSSHTNQC